jgi:hypothetical protein
VERMSSGPSLAGCSCLAQLSATALFVVWPRRRHHAAPRAYRGLVAATAPPSAVAPLAATLASRRCSARRPRFGPPPLPSRAPQPRRRRSVVAGLWRGGERE